MLHCSVSKSHHRNSDMKDTRLSNDSLAAAVDFAYNGAAIREGRKAQARTLASIFRSKPKAAKKA